MMAESVRAAVSPDVVAPGRAFRTLADGERVGGRYEIRRFIARGGMGEVYEAVDTVLHERVALKTLAITASDQGDAAEGLLREVRIARKVTHPNVCRILELGIHRRPEPASDAVPFLTMDFLTGETLAQRLSRVGRLPSADALRLVRDLAAGLGAVHRAGIVHRDFKSENVFLVRNDDGTERTVVMDFGLARVFEGPSVRRSSNGRLIGTPAYMAPEQLTGQPTTPATDVYALGIVTFEMLTGRLPFSGDTIAAVALSRLHQTAPAPSSFVAAVGPGWDTLIECCLQRDPKRRFASIDNVADAIERVGRGESPKRGLSRPTRGWLAAMTLAAIAVAFVGIGVVRAVRSRARAQVGSNASIGADVSIGASRADFPMVAPLPVSHDATTIENARVLAASALPPVEGSPISSAQPRREVAALASPRTRRYTSVLAGSHAPPPGKRALAQPLVEPLEVVPAAVGNDSFAAPASSRRRHPDDLIDPF